MTKVEWVSMPWSWPDLPNAAALKQRKDSEGVQDILSRMILGMKMKLEHCKQIHQ